MSNEQARLEALEHVVSILVSESAARLAEANNVSLPAAAADLGGTIITLSAGFPSKNPNRFGDALLALMKKSFVVAQAVQNVRSGDA